MARGDSSSATVLSTAHAPHAPSYLYLFVVLLLIGSTSAAADRQANDVTTSLPSVLKEVKTNPFYLRDLSRPPRPAEQRHPEHQEPGDEQGKLLSKEVASQNTYAYWMIVMTSCTSPTLTGNQRHSIDISVGDATGKSAVAEPQTQTAANFKPCSSTTVNLLGDRFEGDICRLTLRYGGQLGGWIPSFVKVFHYAKRPHTTFCVGYPVNSGTTLINNCRRSSTAAALSTATCHDQY